MTRAGKYSNTADGFDAIFAGASGGYDTATLTGSSSGDVFLGQPTTSTLYGPGYYQRVRAFDQVLGEGGGGKGHDDATLIGGPGWEREDGPHWVEVHDPARTRWIRAVEFDSVTVTIPSSSSSAKKVKAGLLPVDLLLASEGQW